MGIDILNVLSPHRPFVFDGVLGDHVLGTILIRPSLSGVVSCESMTRGSVGVSVVTTGDVVVN